MKLYLAHPITGLSGADILGYYETCINRLYGFELLHPMLGKEYLRNDPNLKAYGFTNPVSTNHAIFERDRWMVALADIVLVDFSNSEKVSIGCVMELAIAAQLNKHTVVVLPSGNVHEHAFVLEAADIVFQTLDEAMQYLENFV